MTVAHVLGCPSETNVRDRDDFFSTPADCTLAFYKHEGFNIPKKVWEPCSGIGAISKILLQAGHEVIETDLVDRGRVEVINRVDFLMERPALAKAIVTNPPFKLAEEFIEHAYDIGVEYMALLLKADFLHSAGRYQIFHNLWRPARILGLSWRPDFMEQGSPPMNCSWFIWDGRQNINTTFELSGKP